MESPRLLVTCTTEREKLSSIRATCSLITSSTARTR